MCTGKFTDLQSVYLEMHWLSAVACAPLTGSLFAAVQGTYEYTHSCGARLDSHAWLSFFSNTKLVVSADFLPPFCLCTVRHTRFSIHLVCGVASRLDAGSCFTLAFLAYDIEFLFVVQELKLVRLLDSIFSGLLDRAVLNHAEMRPSVSAFHSEHGRRERRHVSCFAESESGAMTQRSIFVEGKVESYLGSQLSCCKLE